MARKPKAGSRKEQAHQKEVKDQAERFRETARKIGVDESGKEFERAFKRIVPPKKRVESAS